MNKGGFIQIPLLFAALLGLFLVVKTHQKDRPISHAVEQLQVSPDIQTATDLPKVNEIANPPKPTPKTLTKSIQPLQTPTVSIASTPVIEPWTQVEIRNFAYANQIGWTAMFITHPQTGEKRYYRKEGVLWVQKASETEANIPYQTPKASQTNITETLVPISSPVVSNTNILSVLSKSYTEQLGAWKINYDKMQEELIPLDEKRTELNCDKNDMSRVIGSIAQQCSTLNAQKGLVLAKYGYYGTPSPSYSVQNTFGGQSYTYYYDGYGSGSIYNNSNPAENYKVYCSYGSCNIYGN